MIWNLYAREPDFQTTHLAPCQEPQCIGFLGYQNNDSDSCLMTYNLIEEAEELCSVEAVQATDCVELYAERSVQSDCFCCMQAASLVARTPQSGRRRNLPPQVSAGKSASSQRR